MYVDDSGSPSLKDDTPFYVISGVIINDHYLHWVEKELEDFRLQHFVSDYKKEEIHLHEICKRKNNFSKLSRGNQQQILVSLYDTIKTLEFTAIVVGIHKVAMNIKYPNWDIFHAAWTFLAERFDMFLCDNKAYDGRMIIDESENFNISNTIKTFNNLFNNGNGFGRQITRIRNEISFFPSYSHYGIQLSDAISYCVLQKLKANTYFSDYWDIVKNKIRSKNGNMVGYGYKVFPNVM